MRVEDYLTWAAAEMGRSDPASADALLAKAGAIDPDSCAVFDLWAQAKLMTGDAAAATALRNRALANTVRFQNIGELAVLYFQPSSQPGQPLTRSKFANPTLITFH